MNTKSTITNGQEIKPVFDHAIVIGGSIAGLTATRVLSDHFARVMVIERDYLPDEPEFRRGVPQTRHVHVLRLRGQQILEQQFPGLVAELLANGAVTVNAGNEAEFFLFGQWRAPHYQSNIVSIACSRPLLETTIYRRLAAHPRVRFIQGHEVAGLKTDDQGERITGVRLRRAGQSQSDPINLTADLVLDASGRGSKAPQWLESLGFTPPKETVVDPFPGYATRLYRRPENFRESWKTRNIIPTPPNNPRGGVLIPVEGDRWQVSLVGMGGDYPPTDEVGFLDFVRSLPSQRLYEAIKKAEPLTRPVGGRHSENRLRHYDQLPRYLEGFLVCGDAACALDPTHAQGMTVAALSSLALDRSLQAQREQATKDLTGLAQTFQQELGQTVAGPWHMATSTDSRWPNTAGAVEFDPATQQRLEYLAQVFRAMVHNPQVAEIFFHVQHMVESPQALFQPDIQAQVGAVNRRLHRNPPSARRQRSQHPYSHVMSH